MTIICNLDYLSKKFIKNFYQLFLKITLCSVIFLSFPLIVNGDVIYPEYTGQKVIDLSQKFDSNYLNRLESGLGEYDTEIRIVFINSENKINLGIYAPKLFYHWNMSDDSILVVIDPYLNKTGYGIGVNVRKKLKARNKIIDNKEKKTNQPGNNIDYFNLPAAIADKFSAEIPKVGNKDDKNNKNGNGNNISGSNGTGTSSGKQPNRPSSPYTVKVFLGIFLLIIFGAAGGFYYNRKQKLKRQLELKARYSLDGEVLSNQLYEIIDKIAVDIEKMSKYQGLTQNELIPHIEKLNNMQEKGTLFEEKLTNGLEEIDLENLYYISELIDEGKMLIENLDQLHKESIGYRKEFKEIIEKSARHLSDIRVNIENCRNLLEEMRTLYNLSLEYSEKKINDCEQLLFDAQELINKNDPYEYRNTLQNIHEAIKELKRDFEIIPHLHIQLQESIPLSINSALEESILEKPQKDFVHEEINNLRNKAIESLTIGNLEQSEQMVNQIFLKLNEVNTEEVVNN